MPETSCNDHRVHVYMDESGDTGFQRGSKFFTVCAFVVPSSMECHKRLHEQRERYESLYKRPLRKEIKASKLSDAEKQFFLRGWKDMDFVSYAAYLNTRDEKNKKNTALREVDKKMSIVTRLAVTFLAEHHNIRKAILDKGLLTDAQIHALRRELRNLGMPAPPKMQSRKSENNSGLAFSDIIAHAVRKHVEGDSTYYNLLQREKIKLIEI